MKKERKKSTFWQDFKQFISRGNIVDLAVAVVVGAAFTAIVNSLVNDIIKPLIALLINGSFSEMVVVLRPEDVDAGIEAITLNYGNLIMAIITFLIDAFVIFTVIRVMRNLQKKVKEGGEALKGHFSKEVKEEKAPAAEAAPAPAPAPAAAAQEDAAVVERRKTPPSWSCSPRFATCCKRTPKRSASRPQKKRKRRNNTKTFAPPARRRVFLPGRKYFFKSALETVLLAAILWYTDMVEDDGFRHISCGGPARLQMRKTGCLRSQNHNTAHRRRLPSGACSPRAAHPIVQVKWTRATGSRRILFSPAFFIRAASFADAAI